MTADGPTDPVTQRQACRAVLQASVDTLLDLDIPPAVIVESLAAMSIATVTSRAVRRARSRSSNDDAPADQ